MLVRSISGLVEVAPFIGMRMQVASPWLLSLMKRVEKRVCPVTALKLAIARRRGLRRILRKWEVVRCLECGCGGDG